mgnify:CR=1 FL=1
MTAYFSGLIAQYGLIAIFTIVCLESLGLPLPGETVILVGAGLAGAGQLNIYAVGLVALMAAVIGDNIGYFIGRRFGRPVIERYGARIGITSARFSHAEAIIQKRGVFVVIIARFIPLLRQLNGLAAGTVGMHWLAFAVSNIIGAALWVGLWSTLAYKFGHSAAILPYVWKHLSLFAMVLVPVGIMVIVYIYVTHFRRRTPR